MPRGVMQSSRKEKKDWLRKHPEVWGLEMNQVRNKLAKAKLCSFTTYPLDMRLEALIEELKREKG